MDVNEMTKYRDLPGNISSTRLEVLECLVEGLQFLKSDAAVPAQQLATRILANIIIEHLDISGFEIYRKTSKPETSVARDSFYPRTKM